MILRSMLGPLSFYTIFCFNQVYKFGLCLLQGTLNVSDFLQIVIITNQFVSLNAVAVQFNSILLRWVSDISEAKIIRGSAFVIGVHLLLNVYELVMVKSK